MGGGGILTVVAACLRPRGLPSAAMATLGPFAMLAAIVAASWLADRLGLFRALARLLIRDRASRPVAAASVLAFTALLSGLVNLDVAVVVAMPVALRAARRYRMRPGRLAVAVATTANAASFLLPTANITTMLLLSRSPLPPLAYLRESWPGWLLVVAVTVAALTGWLAKPGTGPARTVQAGPSARAALDLIPMFAAASALRAILAAGVVLRGGLALQLSAGSVLACVVNNLPAAAALRPAGTTELWAAILATAIGPNLLLTGSVAALICRRFGRDAGVALRAWQYTAVGAVLVPAQIAAAVVGLHITGALH